jgi:2-hydroxycyclohexanecarboxyl-CoA dehydrogenase
MTEKKLAFVTGAAGGMGAATIERLAADGFRIAAMDLDEARLRQAVLPLGPAAVAWPCDQTNEAQVRDSIAGIIAQQGAIDAFVNLTGWAGTTRFFEEKSDYWRKVIAINFESMLYATHAILLNMIERKRGKIVLVASDAGRVGTSGEAVYAGMKGGVIAFAKSIARENARHGINVNVVCPGPTDTPLLRAEMAENPELIQRMVKVIPFRRVGQPKDMANVISFLCSADSDYMTGQALSVSGGLTMV